MIGHPPQQNGALMKRIIFAILLAAAFSFSAMPGVAQAKHHHRHYYHHYYRPASGSHGVGANANVGVGVGPIHVGVGAGGGIHLHAFPPPRTDPPSDPPSDPSGMNSGNPPIEPQISARGNVIVHPSDCDLECYVHTTAAVVDTAAPVTWNQTSDTIGTIITPPAPAGWVQERFALSPDTNINDYYVTYMPPRVVTVGGFSVPVVENPAYYSPFKHGRYGLWQVHNRKGVDVTAGYGVSPRAGPLPESIGGSAYTVTAVGR